MICNVAIRFSEILPSTLTLGTVYLKFHLLHSQSNPFPNLFLLVRRTSEFLGKLAVELYKRKSRRITPRIAFFLSLGGSIATNTSEPPVRISTSSVGLEFSDTVVISPAIARYASGTLGHVNHFPDFLSVLSTIEGGKVGKAFQAFWKKKIPQSNTLSVVFDPFFIRKGRIEYALAVVVENVC